MFPRRVAQRNLGARIGRLPAGVKPEVTKPSKSEAKYPAEFVHADLTGPSTLAGLTGFRYVLVMACVFTRYMWCVPLRKKSDAAKAISYIIEHNMFISVCMLCDLASRAFACCTRIMA